MRRMPVMAGSRSAPYFSTSVISPCGFLSWCTKSVMKPSSLRTFATSSFSFECGSVILSFFACEPLRRRVTMSPSGSLTGIVSLSLLPERHPKALEQREAVLVGAGGGDEADVQPLHLL